MKRTLFTIFLIIGFYTLPAFCQETKKSPAGLGIEMGLGYNMMGLSTKTDSGTFTTNYRKMWIQPCIRIHYDIKVRDFDTRGNRLKIKTLLSYYTFGGKAEVSDIGEYNIVSFSSLEAGAGLAFEIINMFQLTPMIKGQYVFAANERYIREIRKEPTDIKNQTNLFNYNAGLQFRYRFKHFTIALEGWYGLSDVHKSEAKTARESNYRFLFGYEF